MRKTQDHWTLINAEKADNPENNFTGIKGMNGITTKFFWFLFMDFIPCTPFIPLN